MHFTFSDHRPLKPKALVEIPSTSITPSPSPLGCHPRPPFSLRSLAYVTYGVQNERSENRGLGGTPRNEQEKKVDEI